VTGPDRVPDHVIVTVDVETTAIDRDRTIAIEIDALVVAQRAVETTTDSDLVPSQADAL